MYADEERFKLYEGDNRDVLKELPDNSIDSIVTDPPYELGFMGKSWDASGIAFNVEVWQECLRVLKPGGHLLAFSGSRTYHRMAVAIEDAGFEIRDQIMWIYGSGFPKSLDVSKAIDKSDAGIARRERDLKFVNWMRTTGLSARKCDEILKEANVISQTSSHSIHYFNEGQPQVATAEMFNILRPYLPEIPEWVEQIVSERTIESENYKKREVIGTKPSSLGGTVAAGERNQEIIDHHKNKIVDITIPSTTEAKAWAGWGTALKPAHEPIVVARKPLIGTVAANVLTYGTGGLNIDGARVGTEGGTKLDDNNFVPVPEEEKVYGLGHKNYAFGKPVDGLGRWPANVIHDGSDEVVELFPESKGMATQRSGKNIKVYGGNALQESKTEFPEIRQGFNDSGSAARFFYCAKANKRDRNEGLDGFETREKRYMATANGTGETSKGMDRFTTQPVANHHPTVKPTDLMRYLCRLVTPPDGTVLDPFMGSGSTGKAAMYEGFNFVGIEMTEEYLPIAKARIQYALDEESEKLPDADVSI